LEEGSGFEMGEVSFVGSLITIEEGSTEGTGVMLDVSLLLLLILVAGPVAGLARAAAEVRR
jgi:hypothetical protein